MIVNPFTTRFEVYPGTRVLTDDLGLIGCGFRDPVRKGRVWTVQDVLAPIPARALGGIRARVVDNKAFASFVNQRDLEVFLGLADPGQKCLWTGKKYPDEEDNDWYGLCVDDDDLDDDLFARELLLRAEFGSPLPEGINLQRRIHFSADNDAEELLVMLGDSDPHSGTVPDPRVETIGFRWARVERYPSILERQHYWEEVPDVPDSETAINTG